MASRTRDVHIDGMHCAKCERRVKEALAGFEGVGPISISWKTGSGTVTYDENQVGPAQMVDRLDRAGYHMIFRDDEGLAAAGSGKTYSKAAGAIFAVLGLAVVVYLIAKLSSAVAVPDISPTMGLGLLFAVGLLTGFHCVGMCGGFVVGYTTKSAVRGINPAVSHLQYGAGKLLSYTVMGAGFGLLGSFITFTPLLRGVVAGLAGAFLLLYGLSMLGGLPWLKRVRIPAPAFLERFVDKNSHRFSSPLGIGLLNGLMIACGPLQAIYIMAAGSGSAVEGAKMLFVFGAGTLPVMLGFGYTASLISARSTKRVLAASGVFVMVLGLIMINRGLALSGTGLDVSSIVAPSLASENKSTPAGVEMKDGYQIIRMKVTRNGWEPDRFVLVKGVPVKWIITGVEINSCNNAIVVPEYGLNFPIRKGEQVIEFTPRTEGVISWSCWMGMIPGSFVVRDRNNLTGDLPDDPGTGTLPRGGSCRLGGGGTGGCCGPGGLKQ